MSLNFHSIALEALHVDPSDRLRLAAELIDSVEGPEDPEWADAWARELQQRSAAADERDARGEPRGIEWSEARAQILRKLAER